jgi:two-component system, OmpR family, response regulator
MKLLVVDDSELILDRLVGLLNGLHGMADIDTAETLAQTLAVAQAGHPALAILDFHLPDGNAAQIVPALKQMDPNMIIAVLTNDASESNRVKCMKAGSDWFFDKSTEFEKVLELIQVQSALHSVAQ